MIPTSDSVSLDYISKFNSSNALIPLICQHCGINFLKKKSKIQEALKHNKTGLCCSYQCHTIYTKSKKNKFNCANCQKDVFVSPGNISKSKTGNFFCNKSCAASYNNQGRSRHKLRENSMQVRQCAWCNKSIKSKHLCCSTVCGTRYYANKKWDVKKTLIEKTGKFEKENRPLARKYLIEKYGYRCSICNITEWCGQPVPLVCDHIDGNSDNNQLSNLRMICQNCNALLPTFGSKNRGNGRLYKRQKYHIDKLTYKD